MEQHAKITDRLREVLLWREAARMHWYFQLRPHDERDRHAGITVIPLATTVGYGCTEFDETGLKQALLFRDLYRQ